MSASTLNDSVAVSVRCSFCAKDEAEVAHVIAGPGIYICNECVKLCNEILDGSTAHEHPSEKPELPYWHTMSDEQMLSQLPKIAAVASQIEVGLTTWVHRARGRAITWSRIGEALGMTRQSAWGRFSGED